MLRAERRGWLLLSFFSWAGGRWLTVLIDHGLDISQDLAIPSVRLGPRLRQTGLAAPKDTRGLRIEYERDREKSFDPF